MGRHSDPQEGMRREVGKRKAGRRRQEGHRRKGQAGRVAELMLPDRLDRIRFA